MAETAYDLALQIQRAHGWGGRPQIFDDRARLMVREESRWLGVTLSRYDGSVLLHAGAIGPDGTPTDPLAEASTSSSDIESVLEQVEALWQRLPRPKHL
ncbi:hypothetical protein GL263_15715 [Streptomyces durbertensis]|uniref:Uncharacterized protein n=1 Tax=Streptomyces durbertensis TaxID=2448886 RepID=A0ABR6EI32_9ACTN|nr:hypothetical protein [Streptomyces durbertensis]MBB1245004.1 hypothetical protein [Streptomyces durbertensis]